MRTRTAEITLDPKGIVVFRALEGAVITGPDAETNSQGIVGCGGERILVLSDIRGLRSMNREARVFASAFADDNYEAVALVVGNPVSKLIGNFFIGLNKPQIPTQVFSSEEPAMAWLETLTVGKAR